MRFAVVILACVLAVANAQYNPNAGKYFPNNNGRYQNNNQYNRFNNNQYNRFNNNRYNPFDSFNRNQNNYKPFVTSTTPFPRPSVTVVTPAPPVAPIITPVSVVAPVKPLATLAPYVVSSAKVAADARSAETVKYGNEISPDGSYNYFFETNNGIAAQAQGTPRNFGGNPPVVPDVAQGAFSWYSPEGQLISITYVADENGYQPAGDALPQPPPIPPQIARALEYIAKKSFTN